MALCVLFKRIITGVPGWLSWESKGPGILESRVRVPHVGSSLLKKIKNNWSSGSGCPGPPALVVTVAAAAARSDPGNDKNPPGSAGLWVRRAPTTSEMLAREDLPLH